MSHDHALKSIYWGSMSSHSSYKNSDHKGSAFRINDNSCFQGVNSHSTTTPLAKKDVDDNTAFSDDDSEVAQITVSLASLVQLPTEPAVEVEKIECTLQDLVNGDTSETIQNVLRSLRGEHTQKSNINSTAEEKSEGRKAETTSISHGQQCSASRDEDEIKKRMIEKAKRINGAKLNAFALSFVPSSSHEPPLVHDDGLSATGNLDTAGDGVDSSIILSNKLNPTAPSFVPHFIGTS